jgi:hypothetical protein
MKYSKKIGKSFELKYDGAIMFEDGIKYTVQEWRRLVGLSSIELRAIHWCKDIFKGSVDSHSHRCLPLEKDNYGASVKIPTSCRKRLNYIFKG